MKVKCIEKFYSSDPVFNSIQSGDWFEVNEKSINDPNSTAACYYLMISYSREYALEKKYFITEQEWREQQINDLLNG